MTVRSVLGAWLFLSFRSLSLLAFTRLSLPGHRWPVISHSHRPPRPEHGPLRLMTSRLVNRLPDFANRQAGKLRGTPAGFRPAATVRWQRQGSTPAGGCAAARTLAGKPAAKVAASFLAVGCVHSAVCGYPSRGKPLRGGLGVAPPPRLTQG
ncbi:hypothetical protein BJ925_0216 [Rahnella aquatilis]|nr:hypothetical protein BJ925_0216 [Rahnella aquatilis]